MIFKAHLFRSGTGRSSGLLQQPGRRCAAWQHPLSRPVLSLRHARSGARASASSATPAAIGLRPSPQTSVIQISPSGRITSGFAPAANSFRLDSATGVPGLGFDFPHLAAVGGGLRNNAPDFEHHGHRGQGSFVPIFFGGYPYGYEDLGYDQQDQQTVQPSQPQPQIIVIQQPVPVQQGADSGSATPGICPPRNLSLKRPRRFAMWAISF